MAETNSKLSVYGTRGSMPAAHSDFMFYGGNTTSYTLRTPKNGLIFLDAGTGMNRALSELQESVASSVTLCLSHSHEDHLSGGALTYPNEDKVKALGHITDNQGYENASVQVYGPSKIRDALEAHLNQGYAWPVSTDMISGIDLNSIVEVEQNKEYIIDESTRMKAIYGNHPCETGVLLYRFDIEHEGQTRSVVFATDHEFDHLPSGEPNPNKEKAVEEYRSLIRGADIVIAGAPYTKVEYDDGKQGFGHAYIEQVAVFAQGTGVRKLLISHHSRKKDDQLKKLEEDVKRIFNSQEFEVQFAKENRSHLLF